MTFLNSQPPLAAPPPPRAIRPPSQHHAPSRHHGLLRLTFQKQPLSELTPSHTAVRLKYYFPRVFPCSLVEVGVPSNSFLCCASHSCRIQLGAQLIVACPVPFHPPEVP